MSSYRSHYPTTVAEERAIMAAIDVAINNPTPEAVAFMARKAAKKYRPLSLPKGKTWPGTSKRPLTKVYDEAVAIAKANGWPGEYDIVGTHTRQAVTA